MRALMRTSAFQRHRPPRIGRSWTCVNSMRLLRNRYQDRASISHSDNCSIIRNSYQPMNRISVSALAESAHSRRQKRSVELVDTQFH
jgi:hypothetical protein